MRNVRKQPQHSSFLVIVLLVMVTMHAVFFASCRAFRNASQKSHGFKGLTSRRLSTSGGSSSSSSSSGVSTFSIYSGSSSNVGILIDGKRTAADIRQELTKEVTEMKDSLQVVPGLAVVLVGERRDS